MVGEREADAVHVIINGRVSAPPRGGKTSGMTNAGLNYTAIYFIFAPVFAFGFFVVDFLVDDFVAAEALGLPVLISLSPASSSTGFFLLSSSSSGISSSF